jgi:hypothetical protein
MTSKRMPANEFGNDEIINVNVSGFRFKMLARKVRNDGLSD